MIAKFAVVLLLLSGFVSPVTAGCVVDSRTTVALNVADGTITVPLEVNGIAASFVLDTGAQRSVVTQAAVQRLGLARDQWAGTTLSGIGGIDRRYNANPRSLSLGGVPLARRTLNRDVSFTVGILPGARAADRSIDGLLGRDFLSPFDLDLDIPGGRLALYQVSDCQGRFLPWTGHYTSVPVAFPAGQAIVVAVTIDGRSLRALLDTGASASLLAAPGMYRLGLTQTILSGDPADQITGLGPRTVVVRRHRFASLQVGDQTIEQPVLWVEPVRLTPTVDMILGVDWLAGQRVWISFATRQLFVGAR